MNRFDEYWDREGIRLVMEGGRAPDTIERCRHAFEAGRRAEAEQIGWQRAIAEVGEKIRAMGAATKNLDCRGEDACKIGLETR